MIKDFAGPEEQVSRTAASECIRMPAVGDAAEFAPLRSFSAYTLSYYDLNFTKFKTSILTIIYIDGRLYAWHNLTRHLPL